MLFSNANKLTEKEVFPFRIEILEIDFRFHKLTSHFGLITPNTESSSLKEMINVNTNQA